MTACPSHAQANTSKPLFDCVVDQALIEAFTFLSDTMSQPFRISEFSTLNHVARSTPLYFVSNLANRRYRVIHVVSVQRLARCPEYQAYHTDEARNFLPDVSKHHWLYRRTMKQQHWQHDNQCRITALTNFCRILSTFFRWLRCLQFELLLFAVLVFLNFALCVLCVVYDV